MGVYLPAKFQVSSVTRTSFRQEKGLILLLFLDVITLMLIMKEDMFYIHGMPISWNYSFQ